MQTNQTQIIISIIFDLTKNNNLKFVLPLVVYHKIYISKSGPTWSLDGVTFFCQKPIKISWKKKEKTNLYIFKMSGILSMIINDFFFIFFFQAKLFFSQCKYILYLFIYYYFIFQIQVKKKSNGLFLMV